VHQASVGVGEEPGYRQRWLSALLLQPDVDFGTVLSAGPGQCSQFELALQPDVIFCVNDTSLAASVCTSAEQSVSLRHGAATEFQLF
jgi:hypothetical protein